MLTSWACLIISAVLYLYFLFERIRVLAIMVEMLRWPYTILPTTMSNTARYMERPTTLQLLVAYFAILVIFVIGQIGESKASLNFTTIGKWSFWVHYRPYNWWIIVLIIYYVVFSPQIAVPMGVCAHSLTKNCSSTIITWRVTTWILLKYPAL